MGCYMEVEIVRVAYIPFDLIETLYKKMVTDPKEKNEFLEYLIANGIRISSTDVDISALLVKENYGGDDGYYSDPEFPCIYKEPEYKIVPREDEDNDTLQKEYQERLNKIIAFAGYDKPIEVKIVYLLHAAYC